MVTLTSCDKIDHGWPTPLPSDGGSPDHGRRVPAERRHLVRRRHPVEPFHDPRSDRRHALRPSRSGLTTPSASALLPPRPRPRLPGVPGAADRRDGGVQHRLGRRQLDGSERQRRCAAHRLHRERVLVHCRATTAIGSCTTVSDVVLDQRADQRHDVLRLGRGEQLHGHPGTAVEPAGAGDPAGPAGGADAEPD